MEAGDDSNDDDDNDDYMSLFIFSALVYTA